MGLPSEPLVNHQNSENSKSTKHTGNKNLIELTRFEIEFMEKRKKAKKQMHHLEYFVTSVFTVIYRLLSLKHITITTTS